jgi:hypothetical protein
VITRDIVQFSSERLGDLCFFVSFTLLNVDLSPWSDFEFLL